MKVTPLLPVTRVDAAKRNYDAATRDRMDAEVRYREASKEDVNKRREDLENARAMELLMGRISDSIFQSEYFSV